MLRIRLLKHWVIKNGREVEMTFEEKEKKFDPEEVYKGQPNPTKI